MVRITAPSHAGARVQAQALTGHLAPGLADQDVVLDCAAVLVGTPSFLDEIVKQVLLVRGAKSLSVCMASARVLELVERAATNRGVRDRLMSAVPS